jgi:hypothetical protein
MSSNFEINKDSETTEQDKNLMLVYATECYAKRNFLTERETWLLFEKYQIPDAIRKFYNVLHTQDLDEVVFFVDDVISNRNKEKQ